MGADLSYQLPWTDARNQEDLVHLLMPPYYIRNVVVRETDIRRAKLSWIKITEGTAMGYMARVRNPDFLEASCLTWFYNSFYQRMFDVNPSSKPLFKSNIMSQGRVLIGIITTALNQLKEPETFKTMLTNLTHVHSQRGVRGMQYGIAGDVLFWTLDKCLGADFDDETRISWACIFSYMLSIMVPVAVADEIKELKSKEQPINLDDCQLALNAEREKPAAMNLQLEPDVGSQMLSPSSIKFKNPFASIFSDRTASITCKSVLGDLSI
eukprot:CAMPEP_0182416392 /NCGR_PEP_ID=MMETSP1167-20130531/681_1 /TAXON_ID=2988 /ORGANISM="Mallomonas Sp, Strain CCMP3275" /LENGTH=266 /DNA_ID=CAMNT_0024589111 /DNA_START=42 /DNA_END=842 /DNA_ORIENTATION=-